MGERARAFPAWMLILGASAVLAWDQPSAAQDDLERPDTGPPPTYGAINGAQGVPANGALLIAGPPGTEIELHVTTVEARDADLEGTLEQLPSFDLWAWVPAEPFVAGESYEARLLLAQAGGFYTTMFDAVDAIDIVPPEIVTEPSLSIVSQPSNSACCQSLAGEGLLQTAACFPIDEQRFAQLDPGLSTPEPALLMNQFVFRIALGSHVPANVLSVPWIELKLPLSDEQADEYCFTLEAMSLSSGERHTYEGIEHCAAHGDSEALGTRAIEVGAAQLARTGCPGAPIGLEDEWCEVNASCAAGDGGILCELYPHFCMGEPLPHFPDVPNFERDAGSASDAGEPVLDDEPTSGCAVTGARTQGCASGLGILIALVALARRRIMLAVGNKPSMDHLREG